MLASALAGCSSSGTPTRPKSLQRDSLPVAANGGAFVEYYWKQPGIAGPRPMLVFLHGHQEGRWTPGGKAYVDYGVLDTAASRGWVAVAISQPGYGNSTGPRDFMGPRTLAAVQAVLDHFRAQTFVRADRIALEGVSRGAIVASLIAASDSSIRAMVLISGEYDFASPIDTTTAEGRRAFERREFVRAAIDEETDGSAAALQRRSALLQADHIRTPSLLLNGQDDDRTNPSQAQALADRIKANGIDARAIVYPSTGHAIPYLMRERDIRPFLDRYLR